jgi:hypothetical protein
MSRSKQPHIFRLYLSDEAFEEAVRILITPGKPTEAAIRGAELLRKLYDSKQRS